MGGFRGRSTQCGTLLMPSRTSILIGGYPMSRITIGHRRSQGKECAPVCARPRRHPCSNYRNRNAVEQDVRFCGDLTSSGPGSGSAPSRTADRRIDGHWGRSAIRLMCFATLNRLASAGDCSWKPKPRCPRSSSARSHGTRVRSDATDAALCEAFRLRSTPQATKQRQGAGWLVP
jgi:hypothetical protein